MGKKMEDSCFVVVSDKTMLGTKKSLKTINKATNS